MLPIPGTELSPIDQPPSMVERFANQTSLSMRTESAGLDYMELFENFAMVLTTESPFIRMNALRVVTPVDCQFQWCYSHSQIAR